MTKAEKIFTRKYNELRFLLLSGSEYDILKSSAILRLFLIDASPLIDIVNRTYRIKIKYFIDRKFINTFQDGSKLLFTHPQIGRMKPGYSKNIEQLSREKFLSAKIIKTKNETYTVKALIKFLANKEGGVHYEIDDGKKDIGLVSIDSQVLISSTREIVRVLLISLENLKQQIIKIPSNLPFLAHYTTGALGHIYFQGIRQFLETRNMKTEINEGFAVLFEINVLTQPKPGKRVIYELGGTAKCFNFKVQIDSQGCLSCIAKINSQNRIVTSFANFGKYFFNKWISLISIIEFENKIATMKLYIDFKLMDKTERAFQKRFRKVDDQTIGGNLRGKQNAAFKEVEQIILKDKIDPITQKMLFEYFEGNWKK